MWTSKLRPSQTDLIQQRYPTDVPWDNRAEMDNRLFCGCWREGINIWHSRNQSEIIMHTYAGLHTKAQTLLKSLLWQSTDKVSLHSAARLSPDFTDCWTTLKSVCLCLGVCKIHTHSDRTCLQLTGLYISKDIKLPTATLTPPPTLWLYDHSMMRNATICSMTAPVSQSVRLTDWHV